MLTNPQFDRDYLAALVQLSRVLVPVRIKDRITKKWRTEQVSIKSINGVPLTEQIEAGRKAL